MFRGEGFRVFRVQGFRVIRFLGCVGLQDV